MALDFKALLAEHQPQIDPKTVLVLRHTPKEPGLRKTLPRFAADMPDVFNAYQQTQDPKVQNQFLRARYIASFIAPPPPDNRTFFVGLYERLGQGNMSADAINAKPEIKVLQKHGLPPETAERLWFDLRLVDAFWGEWKGKLEIDWPAPAVSWSRWINENPFVIKAIHPESQLGDKPPGHYREWNLRYDELADLPRSWWAMLEQWRAIYYIYDTTGSGHGYVGKASGQRNLRERWEQYRDSGHGGNKDLKGSNYKNFRYSILELVPEQMDGDIIEKREQNWMVRLRTRTRPFGLNNPLLPAEEM